MWWLRFEPSVSRRHPEIARLPITLSFCTLPYMTVTTDRRLEDRAYQDWATEFDRRRHELELQGVPPEEAGHRVSAEMGAFHFDSRSTLHDARQ